MGSNESKEAQGAPGERKDGKDGTGQPAQSLEKTSTKEALIENSKSYAYLTENLGCLPEVALEVSSTSGNTKMEMLETLALKINSERVRQTQVSQKITDKFRRSVHRREIGVLLGLGFSQVDSIRSLRHSRYDVEEALEFLVREHNVLNARKSVKPNKPVVSKQPVVIPPIEKRSEHNTEMLKLLSHCSGQPSVWNPKVIRVILKMKRGAARSREKVKESTPPPTKGKPTTPSPTRVTRHEKEKTLLQQRLENFQLGELVMQGDGNCQFRSLSYELFGSQSYHDYVRGCAVKHMRTHRKDFELFFEQPSEFEAYLGKMEKLGTWGDELTLKASAEALCVNVHVLTSTAGFGGYYLEYIPSAGRESGPNMPHAFLTYLAPLHYNVMTVRDSQYRLRKSMDARKLLQNALRE